MSIFGLISCGINFSLTIIYFLHNKHTCSEFYFLVLQQKQWEQIFAVESFATLVFDSYFHGSVFQNTYCELIFVIIRVIAINRMLFRIFITVWSKYNLLLRFVFLLTLFLLDISSCSFTRYCLQFLKLICIFDFKQGIFLSFWIVGSVDIKDFWVFLISDVNISTNLVDVSRVEFCCGILIGVFSTPV